MPEKHIGIADLARMTRKKLREMDAAQIIHYRHTPDPAAVLVPYWQYIKIQSALMMLREVMDNGKGTAK